MCKRYTDAVIQWQLDRMDYTRDKDGNWIEGEPTREDAIFLLDTIYPYPGERNQ